MRVAIAEDSGIFRQALTTLLTTVGIEVVLSVPTGTELLARIAGEPPDVAILDMRLPPTQTDEGLTTARQIRERHPDVGILILSAFNETPHAMALFQNQPRGVGYLLKDHVTDVTSLHEALQRLVQGEVVIDPDVVGRLVDARRQQHELSRLSDREREVLSLMAEGHSNTGIARRLHLSQRTVEDYCRIIFTKLEIGTVGDTNKRVLAVLAWLRTNVRAAP